MAEGLILEFAGSTLATYRAVSEKLGMDTTNPKADWPTGLRFHAAGSTGAGFLVFEVWDSRDAQDRFMQTRLGLRWRHIRYRPHSCTSGQRMVANKRFLKSRNSSFTRA